MGSSPPCRFYLEPLKGPLASEEWLGDRFFPNSIETYPCFSVERLSLSFP